MRLTRFAASIWEASNSINSLSQQGFLRLLAAEALRWNQFLPVFALIVATTFFATQQEVTVTVDGNSVVLKTHWNNVGAILRDARIPVRSGDIVIPSLSSSLQGSHSIAIRRARPVVVHADGTDYRFRTQGKSADEIVQETGLRLRQEDAVHIGNRNGLKADDSPDSEPWLGTNRPVGDSEARALALAPSSRGGSRGAATPTDDAESVEITVERSIPVVIHDGVTSFEIYTTRHTFAEALADRQLTVYDSDLVFPPLASALTANSHLYILRAKPIAISVDGRVIQARTQAKTVEEAIVQEGIKLIGKDRTEPPRGDAIESGTAIKVFRVKEDVITDQEQIEFATEHRPDPTLEIDERRTSEGRFGVRKWQTRIVYENGEEISRTEVKRWVDSPPVNKVISYGTKIVTRELATPGGTVTYWRKLRMWATSYNASHGGKSRDNPAYGLTRTGMRVTRGIVAIDPNYIPFYARLYVPGYGEAQAADTGGAIKGMMIDLGFDEDMSEGWYSHYTDVYWLTPVPPPDQINYRLLD